jgi:DNA-binding transcriptional LysR family regulator
MVPMFDWNDLKYFLAVARGGSTLAAAKKLATSQSTVQRRLAELERRIGQPLMRRQSSGYRLTPTGVDLLPFAERIEQSVHALEQHLAASERDHIGTLRITCPEPMGHLIAQSSVMERFRTLHPGLNVEFVMCDKYLDLSKGEADVAIRSGDSADDALVGRKIATTLWALYASRSYLDRHGAPECLADLDSHAVVTFDDTMARHRAARWLRQVAPHARVAARNSSVLGLIFAVKSGNGIAPLPVVHAEPDLVRVLGLIPELAMDWWLLTHPDLRRTARVSAFFDFVAIEIDALRLVLKGGYDQASLAAAPARAVVSAAGASLKAS